MAQQFGPAQFIAKWKPVELSERAASQEHFIDVCRLLGQPTPAEHDATGAEYTFEKGVTPTAGASRGSAGERGFADVWWRGKFAWEYKRKGKYRDLTEAYRQLCQYREALENPPLLIVSDIAQTEIHTNFTGTVKQVHAIALADMAEPRSLGLLRRVFTDPLSFKPQKTTEAVTKYIAEQFATIARSLRQFGHDPHTAAHFLMKCMFCLFAEDVELLPKELFKKLVNRYKAEPVKLTERLTELFGKMRTGGDFGAEPIAHFDGGLFDDSPGLRLTSGDIGTLMIAAQSDWGSVEPAIFGTLFERSLDPNTRAQIGAHYTSRDDIMLVVEPVVMTPLRREWEAVKADVEAQLDRRHKGKADTKKKADKAIEKTLRDFIDRLASIRILDPACGSGNFLYVAIQQLLHLEKEVITYAARPDIALGLFPQVRPTQLHGIEINPYAAELAQVVIWIGYLQWMRDNGFAAPRDPILEPLQTIECRDAILEFLPESVPEPPLPEPPHLCGADSARRERRGSGMRERRGSEGRGGHYLLTWTTYGTWLPGDERGFVGRVPDEQGGHVIHNLPGEPYDADEPRLQREALRQRKGTPVKLTREQAGVCVEAFGEVCVKYGVSIDAGAVMANHVHLVVTSDESEGPRLLNLFKGVSSRRLGQRFGKQASGSWWTTGGSRRLLRDERAFENAVNYVRNQGHMLAACETPPPDMNVGAREVNVGARAIASDAIPNIGILPTPGIHVTPSPGVHAGRSQSIPRKPLAVPARWPDADFIIGNPPFLGGSLIWESLGTEYRDKLWACYEIPGFSDLCCYWFELARRAIERNPNIRAGLLATQAVRGGVNRTVLERIKNSGDIFYAWSDRDWILDGAAVHVSIVGFDSGRDTRHILDGMSVTAIHANLATGADTTEAADLPENHELSFGGTKKSGAFDIEWKLAADLLKKPTNVNRRHNCDVLHPWLNGSAITGRDPGNWIIDFGVGASLENASGYEAPFEHVRTSVKPQRDNNKREHRRENWWLHAETCPGMRSAIARMDHFLATPRVSKFRLYAWYSTRVLPDDGIYIFARSDDYFFGVLHSSIHELWARRMGTQLREVESGFRYTPTTCFETFPFPWAPGSEPLDMNVGAQGDSSSSSAIPSDLASPSPGIHAGRRSTKPPAINGGAQIHGAQIHERISAAARLLNEQRERWLNPPEWVEPIARAVDAEDDFADVPEEARALIRHSAIMARAAKDPKLKKRTLTNLYNERPTWLKLAHEQLDRAVLAAYAATDPDGEWSEDWTRAWVDSGAGEPLPDNHELSEQRKETDQRVLAALLRLNLQRAGGR